MPASPTCVPVPPPPTSGPSSSHGLVLPLLLVTQKEKQLHTAIGRMHPIHSESLPSDHEATRQKYSHTLKAEGNRELSQNVTFTKANTFCKF